MFFCQRGGVIQAGQNILALNMRISLQQALRSVPIGHHPHDLIDGDAGALDTGLSMANCRINGNTCVHVVPKYYTSKTHLDGLTLVDRLGKRSALYVVPGNHDASNAVGFYRPMTPPIDNTAMVEIYNLMMSPRTPRTTDTYRYERDKVLTSRDIDGFHFVFLTVWPDSQARTWMETDLRQVSASTPVILFTHDQPDVEAKHLRNPNGVHDINGRDAFENLLSDTFADGATTSDPSLVEQRMLEAFFRRHPNITAYFHGNSNWNQFYVWSGPDHSVGVHTFRVDSPMKGAVSARDETKLSFQVVTMDVASRKMTVRECLWNSSPATATTTGAIVWGASTTVALAPNGARATVTR